MSAPEVKVPAPRRPSDAAPAPVRGADEGALARPAADFLAAVPWAGPAPDPDALSAAELLAWL